MNTSFIRRRPASTSAAPGSESRSERIIKNTYQILLIASLIGNGILGWQAHQSADRLNKLQEEKAALEAIKTRLENQALEAQSTPNILISRVSYELKTFQSLLHRQTLIPFLGGIKDYRIVENEILAMVEHDMKVATKVRSMGRTVTFLLIANVGTVPIYELRITRADSSLVDLGGLQPNSVILMPTKYSDEGQAANSTEAPFSRLQYQAAAQPTGSFREIPIPPPAAQTWTPVLTNVKAIGRALVNDEDKHLSTILPNVRE